MDRVSTAARSRIMASIRGRNTAPEKLLRSRIHRLGFRFRKHTPGLPGRPDMVFPREKVAVFLDGDFWHGYRFPSWKARLPRFWQEKIERNRRRDRKTFSLLRRRGWTVLRVWEHDLTRRPEEIVGWVTHAVLSRRAVSD